MMEHDFKPILVCSLPGSGYSALSEFSLNFDLATCRDLLQPPSPSPSPSPIISRFAFPNDLDDDNHQLNLLRSGVTLSCRCLTRLVTIGMLFMHCHGLRWPFLSSCTIVETHRDLVRVSSQSNHIGTDQRHNHNMLGNSVTTEGNDMPRGSASANESRQFKARNSIPYEDSETSSHKRKSQEKETHFEEQSTAIQNSNPKRQAVNRASRYSSCLRSIIEAIEGNIMGCIPNSITDHDVMVFSHMGAQPSLESISSQPLNSFSCNWNTAKNTKLLFNNLIALPLEDLCNPEKETSMIKALFILADNLSLFSEEQAEQILELLFDFPVLVHSWREYSRSHMCGQKSSAETEKIRDLVKTSVRDEESLKVRYEQLENEEKELMRELEAVQKEKAAIAEKKTEKSKQTKDLISLAVEKAAHRKKAAGLMRKATNKLNNLSDHWAMLRSLFI